MKMTSTIWAVLGILVIAGGLIALSAMLRGSSAPVEGVLPVASDDHVKGASSSPVTLVEYLDFECPSCAAYYPIIKNIEADYGDRVTFVVRHFPLPGHRNALPAALAAEAAGKQGKFWEMHDLLFARQKDWSANAMKAPQLFEGYAQELGLNMEQYRADVASAEVRARVDRDANQGRALRLAGTPTFFLNGKEVDNPGTEAQLRSLLDAALAASAQ